MKKNLLLFLLSACTLTVFSCEKESFKPSSDNSKIEDNHTSLISTAESNQHLQAIEVPAHDAEDPFPDNKHAVQPTGLLTGSGEPKNAELH